MKYIGSKALDARGWFSPLLTLEGWISQDLSKSPGGGGSTAYTLVADPGTFTLTGAGAGTKVSRIASAAPGSYGLSGVAVGLKVARKMGATAGAFALSGSTTGLVVARKLLSSPGTYTLTGSPVNLKAAFRLVCSPGSFTLTGADVGMIYTPGGTTPTVRRYYSLRPGRAHTPPAHTGGVSVSRRSYYRDE